MTLKQEKLDFYNENTPSSKISTASSPLKIKNEQSKYGYSNKAKPNSHSLKHIEEENYDLNDLRNESIENNLIENEIKTNYNEYIYSRNNNDIRDIDRNRNRNNNQNQIFYSNEGLEPGEVSEIEIKNRTIFEKNDQTQYLLNRDNQENYAFNSINDNSLLYNNIFPTQIINYNLLNNNKFPIIEVKERNNIMENREYNRSTNKNICDIENNKDNNYERSMDMFSFPILRKEKLLYKLCKSTFMLFNDKSKTEKTNKDDENINDLNKKFNEDLIYIRSHVNSQLSKNIESTISMRNIAFNRIKGLVEKHENSNITKIKNISYDDFITNNRKKLSEKGGFSNFNNNYTSNSNKLNSSNSNTSNLNNILAKNSKSKTLCLLKPRHIKLLIDNYDLDSVKKYYLNNDDNNTNTINSGNKGNSNIITNQNINTINAFFENRIKHTNKSYIHRSLYFNKGKLNLVLDLDHTLVYTEIESVLKGYYNYYNTTDSNNEIINHLNTNKTYVYKISINTSTETLVMRVRNKLEEFLSAVTQYSDIYINTQGFKEYAIKAINIINKRFEDYNIKSKVQYNSSNLKLLNSTNENDFDLSNTNINTNSNRLNLNIVDKYSNCNLDFQQPPNLNNNVNYFSDINNINSIQNNNLNNNIGSSSSIGSNAFQERINNNYLTHKDNEFNSETETNTKLESSNIKNINKIYEEEDEEIIESIEETDDPNDPIYINNPKNALIPAQNIIAANPNLTSTERKNQIKSLNFKNKIKNSQNFVQNTVIIDDLVFKWKKEYQSLCLASMHFQGFNNSKYILNRTQIENNKSSYSFTFINKKVIEIKQFHSYMNLSNNDPVTIEHDFSESFQLEMIGRFIDDIYKLTRVSNCSTEEAIYYLKRSILHGCVIDIGEFVGDENIYPLMTEIIKELGGNVYDINKIGSSSNCNFSIASKAIYKNSLTHVIVKSTFISNISNNTNNNVNGSSSFGMINSKNSGGNNTNNKGNGDSLSKYYVGIGWLVHSYFYLKRLNEKEYTI